MKPLRLATRGSTLALTQSRTVAAALRSVHPSVEVELVEVRTSGDRMKDVPLGPHLGQGFFTKEIEDALLDGRADLAVHSCKDLATVMPAGLVLAAVAGREDPRDALVGPEGGLDALPTGARVGTSSVRRRRFLAAVRPDLELAHLRGNVPTRVAAVDEGRYDAVVLAAAGLHRLDLGRRVAQILPPDILPPAAAQGALAIQTRDSGPAPELVAALDDLAARAEITAERACLRRLEAGCQAPVGALARYADGHLTLTTAVAAPDGIVRAEVAGPAARSDALGVEAAERILADLGLASLRSADWSGPTPLRLEGAE